tara:strand:+ start:161 stop:427 length:267 start_codon:yes stop_codon:yes gene_type:complete
MSPRLEDVTPDGFNIRYVEFSFGYGTPMNVRDMAIAQNESVGKVAIYKASSRRWFRVILSKPTISADLKTRRPWLSVGRFDLYRSLRA